MEKEPKSVWKKSWKGPRAFILWLLIVFIAAFLGACLVALITKISTPLFDRHPGVGNFAWCVLVIMFCLIIATALLFGVANLILWVFQWRNFKPFLFGCACLATLIALFYAEEDWRGKYEWEHFKRQWEAKGGKFEWTDFVPPAVSDDQNFAMSPVWIAEIKRYYQKEPKRAEAWYGDRIYSDQVSNYCRLLPVSKSAVVGTNWSWNLPEPPETLGDWTVARMSELGPLQSYYRNLEETNPSAHIAITPKPQTPAQDVLLALSKYDPLIERLRKDSQLPYSRFPIEYNTDRNPELILLPHLSVVKGFAEVLELRAIAELQNGQSDKALADVILMLRLADADRVEPFLICHLVRLAVFEIALQPIYEGLANHQWSDSQLAELDAKLSNFDFVADFRYSMRGEMIVLQDGFTDFVRRHPGEIFMNLSSDETMSSLPLIARVIANLIPEGWYYQNEFHANRAMEEFTLPVADTDHEIISPTTVQQAVAAVETDTRHWSPYNVLEMAVRGLPGPVIKFAYSQNAANLARVAIALERYRLAHGEYPDSLDTLAPKFISSLPHDIINGQPLQYRRTSDGQFVLYSVGWNKTNDGGAVIFYKGVRPAVNRKQGDWVWRYPEK